MSPALQNHITHDLFSFLLPEQRDDMEDSLRLVEHFADPEKAKGLQDFAFVVFPTARAYEGFLKQFFYHLGVLDERTYRSRHFRVGRSFNPDIKTHLRDEVWIYDDVAERCTPEVARRLWQMWLSGRNHLFHFFPDDRHAVSYSESRQLVEDLIQVMQDAWNNGDEK